MKKSCTIIVSHFNSLPFLRACIRRIKKHQHPLIDQNIIISDQSSEDVYKKIVLEFPDISIVHTKPLYSGYGIDYIVRNCNIQTDYICQLHTDAFPIHDNWLSLTIGLMEEFNYKFAGILQFVCNKPESIYPYKNNFFAMAQSFHVGETKSYIEMSLNGGFTRYHNRPPSEMTWLNDDWDVWAKEDYAARGSDDDVPAFCWEDNHREHDKLGLGMTAKIGVSGEESGYGSITEDMVFHFGFCRESIGVMDAMGKKYLEWTKRISEGFTDELIEEMLAEARKRPIDPKNGRVVWDGTLKQTNAPSNELNELIQQLKDEKVK